MARTAYELLISIVVLIIISPLDEIAFAYVVGWILPSNALYLVIPTAIGSTMLLVRGYTQAEDEDEE